MNNAIKAGLIVAICLLVNSKAFGNPALTTCRVCGDKVAKEANACPHCGAPDPYPGELTVERHDNGKKKSEGLIRNGEKNELWIEWYENGQKQSEGKYRNGKKDGLVTAWDEGGEEYLWVEYKNGKEISRKEF